MLISCCKTIEFIQRRYMGVKASRSSSNLTWCSTDCFGLKKTIKASYCYTFWNEFNTGLWIPLTKGEECQKHFRFTSSWSKNNTWPWHAKEAALEVQSIILNGFIMNLFALEGVLIATRRARTASFGEVLYFILALIQYKDASHIGPNCVLKNVQHF